MKRIIPAFIILFAMTACMTSTDVIPTAIAQTMAAWTPAPTQTEPPPAVVTQVVTQVVVWTPTPNASNDSCKPITQMDYNDRTKMMLDLQYYVSGLNDVKTVSYVVPEKIYDNSTSELFHVEYVSASEGKVYSKRYIVYVQEFGWKNAVFSIDGQCFIDPPH